MIRLFEIVDRAIVPASRVLALFARPTANPTPKPSCNDCTQARVASHWRSAALLRQLRGLKGRELAAFVESRVHFRGGRHFTAACESRRPLILATPHTETSVIACFVALRRIGIDRRAAILYQQETRNAGLPALLRSLGMRAELLSGFGGVVRALEILQQGGCIATMPDVFQALDDTLAVPFFGRWLRVAGGIGFLAHRARALIVPAYARAVPGPNVRIDIGAVVDAAASPGSDERQSIFLQTCRLFEQFERLIGRAPEHWVYLDRLSRLSTPMEVDRKASAADLIAAVARRCRLNPALARRAPELARLAAGQPV